MNISNTFNHLEQNSNVTFANNVEDLKSTLQTNDRKEKPNKAENNTPLTLDIKGIPYLGYATNGDTTILGKLYGYDKSMSSEEVEDLRKFIYEEQKVLGLGVFMYNDEFSHLFNSTLSIEEFKRKYIQAKEEFESKRSNIDTQDLQKSEAVDSNHINTKEIYQKQTLTFTTKLIQNQQISEILSLFFNQKSKEEFNLNDFENFIKPYLNQLDINA